jgi:hypothetical protein
MPTIIQPKIDRMRLYIPVSGTPLRVHVEERSVIAGTATEGRVSCAYEGGMYDPNMTFDEKLTIACWRLSERSPSVAYATPPEDELLAVAEVAWDKTLRAWTIAEVLDHGAFVAWFGEEPVIGGSREQRQRAAGLIIDNGRNVQAVMVMQRANAANEDAIEAIIEHARAHA